MAKATTARYAGTFAIAASMAELTETGALIEPFYATTTANQAIPLGQAPLQIACGDRQFTCPGEASLYLQPHLRLTVNADLSGQPATTLNLTTTSAPITLQYGRDAPPVRVLLVSATTLIGAGSLSGNATFVPASEPLVLSTDRRKRLAAVTFHVMNFPAFSTLGDGTTDFWHRAPSGRQMRLGRAVLEHAGWRVELQQLPETSTLIGQLEDHGGFAITHVGRLTRANGRTFWISQAEAMLADLRRFLSFCRGLWVPVVLPVGIDASGTAIFEEWGSPLGTPWEPRVSWFDDGNGQALAELYPGFVDLLHNPDLGEAVKVALYWYLQSNRAGSGVGVDSGVILSQAALEGLAAAYLEGSHLRTAGNTTQRLRRALRHVNLPTEIPKWMAAISAARRKGAWDDLPEVIVKVRNELVHPKKRLPFRIRRVVAPAWNIAQWYIELFVLALSGYRSHFRNRLRTRQWRGDVERVPWT